MSKEFSHARASEELKDRLKSDFWVTGQRISEVDEHRFYHELEVHFHNILHEYNPVERGLTTQSEWDSVETRDIEQVPF